MKKIVIAKYKKKLDAKKLYIIRMPILFTYIIFIYIDNQGRLIKLLYRIWSN